MTTTDVIQMFSSTDNKLASLEKSLPAERWAQAPSAGGWSPLQNIEHLNLITREFLTRFESVGSELRAMSSNRSTQKMELIGRLLTKALSSNARMIKMKSPANFIPKGETNATSVLSTFHRNQKQVVDYMRTHEHASLDRVKIVSPFDGRFKYSIFSALNILSAEQERHFRQIERSIS
jgi:hypothetical protein